MVERACPAEATSRSKMNKPTTRISKTTQKGSPRTSTNSSSTTNKNNDDRNIQCSDEYGKAPMKPSGGQRKSLVHDFPTKTSPNEYVYNIYTTVS